MRLDFKDVGDKIKKARGSMNLTQEALAEKANLSVTHISAIENASSKFSVAALVNIADALEISIDWLLFSKNGGNLYVEHQVERILTDCSEREIYILLTLLKNNKEALREFQKFETLPFSEK